jgi:hypothetical protein
MTEGRGIRPPDDRPAETDRSGSNPVSYPQILFLLLTDWSGHEQPSAAEIGGF